MHGAAALRCARSRPGEGRRDACRPDGAFFLDFGRPLRRERFFGVWNPWLGPTMALTVPVAHEGEVLGRHVVAVDRVDPYFGELVRLWQQRYPTARRRPVRVADPERVRVDFAAQFPDDARLARLKPA